MVVGKVMFYFIIKYYYYYQKPIDYNSVIGFIFESDRNWFET